MAMLEVKNLEVYYGVIQAIKGISFEVNEGEVIALIGANGAGKTTTLQTITGMLQPKAGEIIFEGKDISKIPGHKIVSMGMAHVPEGRRVFAELSVYENLKLGAYTRKDKKEIEETLARVYKSFPRLEERKNQLAGTLSGGEQQMLAMGRALMSKPKIILMDEPFGALDPITRDSLQELVKQLQQELGKTVIFVTHDMDEALKLADRIVIMQEGKVVQFDTPDNILMDPANEFVENFIGEERLSQARTNYRTVEQIMILGPVSVSTDQNLSEAIKLMRTRRVDSLFVTDAEDVLLGMLSVEAINQNRRRPVTAGEIMSEVSFVREGTLVRDALQRILKLGYKNIPVVDAKKHLIGLITRTSIVDMVYDTIWGDIEPEMPAEEVIETTADIETVKG